MEVIPLQSGSSGNSIYVRAAGVQLLVDAGISCKAAKQRLAEHELDARNFDGILVTHDHSDHVSSLGAFHRKFGLPIYITPRTLQHARKRGRLQSLGEVHLFQSESDFQIGDLKIESIRTPHDAVDGVCFVFDDGQNRLGLMTDLGHVTSPIAEAIHSLDAVLIESNYDPAMLENGPYPWHLKQRISGPGGHLSNQDAAELLAMSASSRLQWAYLGHLSEHNNAPEIALKAHRAVMGDQFELACASRSRGSNPMRVGASELERV